MNQLAIQKSVESVIVQWEHAQERKHEKRGVALTPGAKAEISRVISNIEADPSPHWKRLKNVDAAQEKAIAAIPAALDRFAAADITKISSWEIWHGMSIILDAFCFIPKK